ncbi:MAG: carbohydrate-binding domain-containing protein [Ignavibacteria bacterium]|jgi:hypothetical protein|nr:carbohydrate-binding domain-containing protein [Ignavibacteria bacterium]
MKQLRLILCVICLTALLGCGGDAVAPPLIIGGDRIKITFNDGEIAIDNPYDSVGVQIQNDSGHIIITSTLPSPLIIEVSGKTSDGQIKYYSGATPAMSIYLNNIDITNSRGGSAINIQSKLPTQIININGTTNYLNDSKTYPKTDEDEKATVFSEGDLTFSSDGTNGLLTISSNSNKHAICSDKKLEMRSGNIFIKKSGNDGIHTNDLIMLSGGKITMSDIAGDGIQTDGDIMLHSGTYDIMCVKHGFNIEKNTYISGGTLTIKVSGDGSKCINSTGDILISDGKLDLTATGNAYYDTDEEDMKSVAGIKCDKDVLITNCDMKISVTGLGAKALNCQHNLMINNGNFDISATGESYCHSKDTSKVRGIKCDSNIVINGGNFRIYTPYEEPFLALGAEGISCTTITITGGTFDITSGDDCISAGSELWANGIIDIRGGVLLCNATYNDAIDCNGKIYISGGLIVANGAGGIEDGFDCDAYGFYVMGGTIIGTGGSRTIVTDLLCSSNLVNYSGKDGDEICIKDHNDNVVMMYKHTKFTNSPNDNLEILFSTQYLLNGDYTLLYGGHISGGTNQKGYITGGTYSGGTEYKFTISKRYTLIPASDDAIDI